MIAARCGKDGEGAVWTKAKQRFHRPPNFTIAGNQGGVREDEKVDMVGRKEVLGSEERTHRRAEVLDRRLQGRWY